MLLLLIFSSTYYRANTCRTGYVLNNRNTFDTISVFKRGSNFIAVANVLISLELLSLFIYLGEGEEGNGDNEHEAADDQEAAPPHPDPVPAL